MWGFKTLSHCAMFRPTSLKTLLGDKLRETLHTDSVTYLATTENVARQVAEAVVETFCNDFKQLSASLRSHTSLLPSVNASAKCSMKLVSQCVATPVARKIAQCDSDFTIKCNLFTALFSLPTGVRFVSRKVVMNCSPCFHSAFQTKKPTPVLYQRRSPKAKSFKMAVQRDMQYLCYFAQEHVDFRISVGRIDILS